MSVSTELLGFLWKLENYIDGTQEAIDEGPIRVESEDNDEEDVVLQPISKESVSKMRHALSAFMTIAPVIHLIDDFIENEISETTFQKRWDMIMEEMDEAVEEQFMGENAHAISNFLDNLKESNDE